MDLIRLTADGRLYNFHSHTQFCDGRASMEQFAAAAVAAGFTHYGFSPHSPTPFPTPCNMAIESVPSYLAEVDRLRQIHAGAPTRFYASMEIDFISDEWGPATDYFQQLPLDYRIGSVHFIPSSQGPVDVDGSAESFRGKMARYFNNDIRRVVEEFYAQTARMIELGGFDIIGHFDKIGHNASHFHPGIEQESWYQSLVADIIRRIADAGIIAEVNTKAYEGHNRIFPSCDLLPQVAQAGIQLVVNSDAHYPHLIDASRREAFDMIAAAGIHLP